MSRKLITKKRVVYVVSLIFAVLFTLYFISTRYSRFRFSGSTTGLFWQVFSMVLCLISVYSYFFLAFSFLSTIRLSFICQGTEMWRDRNRAIYESLHNISLFKNFVTVAFSIPYCLYPIYLLAGNFDLQHNVVNTAMMLTEAIVAFYAGFDMLQNNNLRWFLRTIPYCLTGLIYVAYALWAIKTHNESILFKDDPLVNAVLSFVTITYFVQVFNERICKQKDDRSDAQTKIISAADRPDLINKVKSYTLVNPSHLEFSHHAEKSPRDCLRTTLRTVKAEGLLVYDTESNQYLGCLLVKKSAVSYLALLPCTNGARYDTTCQTHPDAAPFGSGYGTCTVIGSANQQ